jgi:Bacterial Ig-like domain (group 3)
MATPKQFRRRGRFALITAVLVGALVVAAVALGGVSTDSYYYAAGQTVQITGDNMAANEQVTVDVTYPDGSLAQEHSVAADANGNFADSYTIKDTDPAGVYTVKATGQESGSIFTTQFDPNNPPQVNFATSGLTVAIDVSYNGTNNGSQAISGPISVPASGTSSGITLKAGSILTFGFPLTVSETGLNCSRDSTSESSPYTAGPLGSAAVTITGTYSCVPTTPPDTTPPTVSSIDRSGSSPTNASSVSWDVAFSEDVTGVDSGDFSLATSGVSGASITSVTGSGSSYIVTASTGTGDGTIGLNLVDNDSIVDGANNKLGGTGTGNGDFTGQTYTIDKTPPTVTLDLQAASDTGTSDSDNITKASTLTYDVTFSESVTGVAADDFSTSGSGAGTCSVGTPSGSGASYTVTLSSCSEGAVTLIFAANGATDLASNPGPTSAASADAVTIDRTAPTITHTIGIPKYPTLSPTYVTSASQLTFSVNDNAGGSGIDTCTITVSGGSTVHPTCTKPGDTNYMLDSTLFGSTPADGSYTNTADATDVAGNAATQNSFSVTLDNTAPAISVLGFTNGHQFIKGVDTLPTPTCSTADDGTGSGVASQSGPSIKAGTGLDAGGVGSVTYQCTATDNLGNSQTVESTYSVIYGGLSSILQPINPDNTSVFNRGKAIPVKFQLAGDEYTGFITTGWKIQQQQVACSVFDGTDAILETSASNTPSTVFRYDSSADQYIYNADMHTQAVGTCWNFKVTLGASGQVLYSAVFKLQK